MTHEQAIALLKDIKGMDVSWWQALLAWLAYYGGIALVVAAAAYFGWRWWQRRRLKAGIWSMKALLDEMSSSSLSPKEKAAALNEWLRRLAIMNHGRDIAGIVGAEWLTWLDENTNSPPGFSWRQHGMFIIEMPYAPPSAGMDELNWQQALQAAALWLEGFEKKDKAK